MLSITSAAPRGMDIQLVHAAVHQLLAILDAIGDLFGEVLHTPRPGVVNHLLNTMSS